MKFSVRVVEKSRLDPALELCVRRDIYFSDLVDHPASCRLIEAFESKTHFHIIKNLINGTTLEKYIQKEGGYLIESDASQIAC